MTEDGEVSIEEGLRARRPLLWLNPALQSASDVLPHLEFGLTDMLDAESRFVRCGSLLASVFPEVAPTGIFESPLRELVEHELVVSSLAGALWAKCDNELPVAGSIKARGGVHEVLAFAESLLLEHGMDSADHSSALCLSAPVQDLFRQYTVVVGSTGNLGMSIGIVASGLGFRTVVHMSSDAKDWKKQRLRDAGAMVIEHAGDYAAAVACGRRESESDPYQYFVDDERSSLLFLGYSVAALRIQQQFIRQGIEVDEQHPLFVYLPCGVGGAPAGIAFGLKQVFGNAVHCFFAEPTEAPCVLWALASGRANPPSIYELGLSNDTEADGLAVDRASPLAIRMIRNLVSGIYTVSDESLFPIVAHLHEAGIRIEPSAATAFAGPNWLLDSDVGRTYIDQHNLRPHLESANHVCWATGGLFVPDSEFDGFVARGRA